MDPKFLRAHPEVRWTIDDRHVSGRVGALEVHADRKRFSSRWNVRVIGAMPGEAITLYITRGLPQHGYFRDLLVGHAGFDAEYFVYCDQPALTGLVVGPRTREAIGAANERAPFVVHARHGLVETSCEIERGPDDLIAIHARIHEALAADLAAHGDNWTRIAGLLGARVLNRWPPVFAMLRPIGTVTAALSWRSPADFDGDWTRAESSLTTELVAERAGRGEPWRLDLGTHVIGWHRRIGDRWFEVTGEPTLSYAELGHAVEYAGIVGIRCDRIVAIQLRGMTGESWKIDHAVDLLARLSPPTEAVATSPYR